jgi:hypothetical protein
VTEQIDGLGLTPQTELALETMMGDVAERLQRFAKNILIDPKPWDRMTEMQQRSINTDCVLEAKRLCNDMAKLLASRGEQFIEVAIGKFSGDIEKGIQFNVGMSRTADNLLLLNEHLGQTVLLVPLAAEEYSGKRSELETDNVGDLAMPKNGKGGELKEPRTGPGAPSDPDAEAQLGRGPVKPNEAMPGDIGPMVPAAAPVDGDGNPVAHDPQTGEAQEPAHG